MFVRYRVHGSDGIERLGGVYDLAAMAKCCEETEGEAEAVEEGRWAAKRVGGG